MIHQEVHKDKQKITKAMALPSDQENKYWGKVIPS